MVLQLRNSGQRTCNFAPLPPPRSLDYISAAQTAAQERQELLVLPKMALPASQQDAAAAGGTLWGLGEQLLQPRPAWEQLPSLRRLQELGPPGPYALLQPQPLPLSVQEPKAAGPPVELLHRYRTPGIDERAVRNKGNRGALSVPLLVDPLEQLAQEKSLSKQLELALDLSPVDVPSIPPPTFTAPDLPPCSIEVPGPVTPPWSLLEHLAASDRGQPRTRKGCTLLPTPIPFASPQEQGSCGSSLRQEMLLQLADQSHEFVPDLAALAAPIPSLRSVQFGSCQPELHPVPIQLPPVPPQPILPPFMEKLCGAPSAAAARRSSCMLPHLEAPLLLAGSLGSGLGASCCLAELFEAPLPEPPPGAGWLPPLPGAANAPTMATLLAQDMELDDGRFMLPPVVLGDSADGSSADSGASGLLTHQLQAECGIKPASTAHLALYLDWSLTSSNPSLRPLQLAAAARELTERILPKELPVSAAPSPADARAAVLPQLLSHYKAYWPRSTLWQPRKLETGARVVCLQPTGAKTIAAVAQQEVRSTGTGGQVAAGPPAPVHAANRAPPAPGLPPAQDDLQYFLQMRGPGRRQPAPGVAAHEPTQSSDSAAERIEEFLGSAARSVAQVALPESHMQLLRLLQEDEQRVVTAVPGLSKAVSSSDFLSVDALQAALQEAAGRLQKELLRAYAAMVVIRQTAMSLVHHGVRCAHLYLSQSAADLPGLLNGVTAARDLHQAYLQVESSKMEDHPKQAALRRALCGMETLSPGCNVLVVADGKSFFTIYHSIQASGFRVCQLDKDEGLLHGGSESAVEAALQQALTTANCVLVSMQLATSGLLASRSFQHVLQYISEPEAQAALEPFLASCTCPQLVMQVTLGDLPSGPVSQAGAACALPPQQQAGGIMTAAQVYDARAGAQVAHPLQEWPVVVSSDTGRPIRQQRALYEAILQLEREGASVVERPLSLIDAVLSPSAALIIFDNTVQCVEFAPFLEGLQPMLERVSYAFSKVVLICQGNSAFQAQVLCGMAQLLAVGQSYGLRLQCFPSTSTAATGVLVRDTAEAFLKQWAGMDPKLHFAIPDPPTQAEQFLTRFPSLNSHSAMLLASQGASLQQLLHLDLSCQEHLPQALSLIPRHSLELFVQSASHGSPVLSMGCGAVGESTRPGQQGVVTPATSAQLELSGSAGDGYLSPQGSLQHHQHQQPAVHGDHYSQPGLAKRVRMASGAGGVPLYHPEPAMGRLHQSRPHIPSIPTQLQQPQQQHPYEQQQPYGVAKTGAQQPIPQRVIVWPQDVELQQPQLEGSHGYASAPQHAYPPADSHRQQQLRKQSLPCQPYSFASGTVMLQPGLSLPGGRLPAVPHLNGGGGNGPAGYLPSQPARQQQTLPWDPCYEPCVSMNDMVYQRSMQMMQSRLAPGQGAGAQPAVPRGLDTLPEFDIGLPELDPAPVSGLLTGNLGGMHLAGAQAWPQQPPPQQQLVIGPAAGQASRQHWLLMAQQQQRGGHGFLAQAQHTAMRQQHQLRAVAPQQEHQQQAPFSQQLSFSQQPPLYSHRPGMQQAVGPPGQWAQGPEPQHGSVDEFGVSLEPSISDEESDRDATMSARLSPLGFGQQQHYVMLAMGGQDGHVDPISSLLDSRTGFAPPRLITAGAQAAPGRSLGMVEGGGPPPAKRHRGPQAAFARRMPGQQAATAQKRKYGKGCAGTAQLKGGAGKRGAGGGRNRGGGGPVGSRR